MVGHTGSLEAAIAAVKAVDGCLARVIPAILAAGGAAIVTADHGNCEQMWDYTLNAPHTAHTPTWCRYIFVQGLARPTRGRCPRARCATSPRRCSASSACRRRRR